VGIFWRALQRTHKTIGTQKHIYQRAGLLSFLAVFLATIIAPSAYALEDTAKQAAQSPPANSHVRETPKQVAPKQNYAGPIATAQTTNTPAADYVAKSSASALDSLGIQGQTAGSSQNNTLQGAIVKTKPKAEELIDKRTANTATYRNADGTYSVRQYSASRFYQKDGSWQAIDTKLVEDKNAGDSGNVFGKVWGQIESVFSDTTTYTISANSWQARFAASDAEQGMVRIKQGNSQVGFSPVNAASVKPVITVNGDTQFVRYPNLWPGVDVEYSVHADQVKENIILKTKQSATRVQFALTGASLKATGSKTGAQFSVDGALGNGWGVAPANLILNTFGLETDHSKFSQTYADGKITISVNKDYLQQLPDAAFPVVVDPTYTHNQAFGTRAGGNYVSFKSDGYVCYSNECNLYAGSLIDSNGIWRSWRGAFYADYSEIKGKQLDAATLHLTKRSGVSFYTGTSATQGFKAYHASCLGYNCTWGTPTSTVNIAETGDLDVKDIYSSMAAAGDYGGWLMVLGTEVTSGATTFKNFDPDNSYITLTYTDILPAPAIQSPVTNQVFVDPQVSFATRTYNNPASGAKLQNSFCVSTSGSCGGAVMVSNSEYSDSWTVPDGILQDGVTYYVQARTYDPAIAVYSGWGPAVPFRIDQRTGKDSTQAYDTLGPVQADLATGNVSTGIASHTSTALGGDLGVKLDYNSPVKSRNGLVGQYYNNQTQSGTPALTRVDQNIDFAWATGSPSGAMVNSDSFSVRWSGYFVAPVAGTYYFGGLNDDNMKVTVNGTQVYNNGGCYVTTCYDGSVTLTAGQVVPLQVDFIEGTSTAFAKLYVKGAIAEQIVPKDMLQTGIRAVAQDQGLTGRFYNDTAGDHDFTNAANTLFLQRNDPLVGFNWNMDAPASGTPADKFMARWTGYITVPTTGSYYFGSQSDDGTRITVNSTQVYSKWNDSALEASPAYGSAITLTAGQSVPITIDYYENGGPAGIYLWAKGAVTEQVVPSSWLSTKSQVLPAGWKLGIDADGNVAYDHIKLSGDTALLYDSTGSTHEYTWNNGSYKPPANEYGNLTRNNDATYTFQDADGRTYVFSADGTLASVTSPTDDLKPAALKYTYGGTPSKLTQITDGVSANRWAKVYYSGDSNCGSAPTGFDSAPPSGMLCALKTNDGRATYFYYKSGNLARVQMPGNEMTDYGYDTVGRITSIRDSVANDAIAAGVRADNSAANTELLYDNLGRVTSVTQPAATTGAARTQHTLEYFGTYKSTAVNRYYNTSGDHLTSSSMPAFSDYRFQLTYGHVLPNALSGTHALYSCKIGNDYFVSLQSNCENQVYIGQLGYAYDNALADGSTVPIYRCYLPATDEHFESPQSNCEGYDTNFVLGYLPSSPVTMGTAYTQQHVVGASEPNGFTRKVEYDGLFRTTKDTDVANLSDTTQWDPAKDLVLSTTDETGLKSTTIYDDEDRAVSSYGPAPAAWFGTDRKPLSAYVNQVARTDTAYDQNMYGPATAYYTYDTTSKSLVGTPKAHTTNVSGATSTNLNTTFSTSPISGVSSNWGFRGTGRIKFPSVGSYSFRVYSDGGVRVYIDDQLMFEDWNDGAARYHAYFSYNAPDTNSHRLRIEYFHTTNTPAFALYMIAPGGTEASQTSAINSYISPDYSLATSTTSYDSSLGNTTTTTNYGSSPEYGLAQSTTTDPSGLNLTTSSTYESPSTTTYLRQTSKTLPGGEVTNYGYYAGGETRDNPCTTGTVEAYDQGGQMKLKTEPDPDGTGTQTSRTTETVYDDAGRVVATRYNSDSWTCTTYDSRGRVLTTTIPAYNGSAARTITNDYAVGGNPLTTSSSDNFGPISTTIDLLGRTVSYTDIYGDTTTSTYDNYGKLTQRVSPMGTEVYEYDTYSRLTNQKLDGTILASVTYDAFGRINYVTYPTAGSQKETYTYDTTTGKVSQQTYILGNGTSTVSDAVTRSQSGQITASTQVAGGVTTNSTYGYDNADRLTSATVGSNTYSYSFGVEDASCGTGQGTNINAGKSGNRTSQTVNGATTTYCYDNADRLVSSSNAALTTPTYDTHGNTLTLGTGTGKSIYTYDSSDRNKSITNYNGTKATYYDRDVQGRIVARYHDVNNVTQDEYYYNFTASGDTPDYARNAAWQIAEKYIDLPGDVQLTIRPLQTGNAKNTYSLANIHSDVIATTNTSGTLTGSYIYDPFGNLVSGSSPDNQAGTATNAWVGNNQKLTEEDLPQNPIQMGARVYLASTGRFLQVDPVEGGTDNNYAYVNDPVNDFDLTGQYSTYSGFDAYSAHLSARMARAMCGGWWIATCIPVAGLGIGAGRLSLKGIAMLRATRAAQAADAVRIARTGRITVKAVNIGFKTAHAARHLKGTNLTVGVVEKSIRADIVTRGLKLGENRNTIRVGRYLLEYRAYLFKDGRVSVGTYFTK